MRSQFWQQTYKDAFDEEHGGLHSRGVVTEEVAPIVLQVLGICEGNHRDDRLDLNQIQFSSHIPC